MSVLSPMLIMDSMFDPFNSLRLMLIKCSRHGLGAFPGSKTKLLLVCTPSIYYKDTLCRMMSWNPELGEGKLDAAL